MKLKEFKEKYFTNNFYWISEDNHKRLQEIAIEVGCVNPSGDKSLIKWHDGFKNLGFRTYEKNGNITRFQKEGFLLATEEATDYNEMIASYSLLKLNEKLNPSKSGELKK